MAGLSKLKMLPLVLFAFTAQDGRALAAEVTWRCPRTHEASVPVTAQIDIPLTINDSAAPAAQYTRSAPPVSNARLAVEQFRTMMLTTAATDGGSDYFACGQSLLNRALDTLFRGANALYRITDTTPEPQRSRYVQARRELEDRLNDVLRTYGEKAYRTGALPPFEPAGTSVPPLSQAGQSQLRERLRTQCSLGAEPRFLDRTMMERLPQMLDGLNTDCKNRIRAQYSQLILDSLPDTGGCKLRPEPCRLRKRAMVDAAALLAQSGLAIGSTPDVTDRIAHCGAVPLDVEIALRGLVDDLEQAGSCGLPSVGEETHVANPHTTAGSDYYLKRLPDVAGQPVMQATVNLSFVDPTTGNASPQAAQMSARLRGCYEQVRDKLRGPNGERLVLNLVSDSSRPIPPKRIKVRTDMSDTDRENMTEWSNNAQCATLVHETMHMLGLCDEYKEKYNQWAVYKGGTGVGNYYTIGTDLSGSGDHSLFDCRNQGPSDSVMSNSCLAYRSVGLEASGAICPAGNPAVKPRTSLLYPAQFRAITQPFCTSANRTFYACSREAYKTSRGRFGLDRCARTAPAACNSGNPADWMQ